jgi:hypothetical protein
LTTSGQGKMLRADLYPHWAAESGAANAKLRVCFFTDDRTDTPSWIDLSFVVGICIRRRRRFRFLQLDTQKKLSCTTRCKKVVVFGFHHRQEELCWFYSRAVNLVDTQIFVCKKGNLRVLFFFFFLGSSARFGCY